MSEHTHSGGTDCWCDNKLASPCNPECGLRYAAMWVVLNWDGERSQHTSMPELRKAVGFPPEPPTRDEAEARINAFIGIDI